MVKLKYYRIRNEIGLRCFLSGHTHQEVCVCVCVHECACGCACACVSVYMCMYVRACVVHVCTFVRTCRHKCVEDTN